MSNVKDEVLKQLLDNPERRKWVNVAVVEGENTSTSVAIDYCNQAIESNPSGTSEEIITSVINQIKIDNPVE